MDSDWGVDVTLPKNNNQERTIIMKNLGFIGTGNIGSAIIGGVLKTGLVEPAQVIAADVNMAQLTPIIQNYGIHAASNIEVAQQSDVLFLCLKPAIFDTVINQIREHIRPGAIIVSVAAGMSIATIEAKFNLNPAPKIARVMPNIPAVVGCAMTAICTTPIFSSEETDWLVQIFNSFGLAEILPEHQFDAFTAIASSSPAYAFMFIEALADAGVKHGLSRAQALRFSTQAVLGAAQMLKDTGGHPALLKDAVCTPGGTTIEAVCELEKQGFKNTVISSVNVCVQKSMEMRD